MDEFQIIPKLHAKAVVVSRVRPPGTSMSVVNLST